MAQTMHTEHEIKVLDINSSAIAAAAGRLGFEPAVQLNFRRYVYDIPGIKDAWLRLRTDGEHTTITYKQVLIDAIDGVKELELEVNDLDTAHHLLELLGYTAKKYQENRRTLYKNNQGVELAVDVWPHIPPYLEIEAPTRQLVEHWLTKLQLTAHKTTSLSTQEVYKIYGKDLDDYPILTFSSTALRHTDKSHQE